MYGIHRDMYRMRSSYTIQKYALNQVLTNLLQVPLYTYQKNNEHLIAITIISLKVCVKIPRSYIFQQSRKKQRIKYYMLSYPWRRSLYFWQGNVKVKTMPSFSKKGKSFQNSKFGIISIPRFCLAKALTKHPTMT